MRPVAPTFALLVSVSIGVAACDSNAPTTEQLSQIRALYASAQATSRENTAKWLRAIEHADVVPRPDLGPCPINVGDPVLAMADNLGGLEDLGLEMEHLHPSLIVDRVKLAKSESPRGRMITSQLRALGDPKEYRHLTQT